MFLAGAMDLAEGVLNTRAAFLYAPSLRAIGLVEMPHWFTSAIGGDRSWEDA
jgi:hypothetical protein